MTQPVPFSPSVEPDLESATGPLGGPIPDPRRERVAVRDGLRLSVLAWEGAATPFVLVHGLASNARLWEGVGVALASAGHRVVAVDQRGHGESDRPAGDYGFEAVTDDLAALVERLGLDRPVLVGQSWGADVVLEAAVRRPGLARGIACVDGAVADIADAFPDWEACEAALAPPHLDGLAADAVRGHVAAAHPDWPAWGIEAVLANFDVRPDGTVSPRLARDRHLAILRALWEHRPSRLYPRLTVPALLLPAEGADAARNATRRQAVAAAIAANPRVAIRWFSPADHDVHVQQAAAVATALRTWLLEVVDR
ncbi:MAG TPA: alpha/beta hydrolase [Candidatus Limnocylindrales bacterium]